MIRRLSVALMAGAAWVSQVQAQSAADAQPGRAPGAASVEELVVTANKRAERASDVAMGLTAITGARLSQQQMLDLEDLELQVPGLNVEHSGSSSEQRLIIRGVNTDGAGATVASTVDNVPLTSSSSLTYDAYFASDFEPFDMQRVEVLKGPQGTLYGADAEGGLIKYVTNPPELGAFHAGGEATTSDLEGRGATGAGRLFINVPIGDRIAFRATGYYDYEPGWIDDQLDGQSHVNTLRRYGERLSLLVKPTDAFTARFTAIFQNYDHGGFDAIQAEGSLEPSQRFTPLAGQNYNTYIPQPSHIDSRVYIADLDYEAGPVNLESITSYSEGLNKYTADDTIYESIFTDFYGLTNTTLGALSTSKVDKFNQELRISSREGAPEAGLHWQAGAFFTSERSSLDSVDDAFSTLTQQPATTPFGPSPELGFSDLNARFHEAAVYGDADYFLVRQFDIEAGVRVFHNWQTYTATDGGALVGPTMVSGPFSSKETNATFAVEPRFHLSHDGIVYARIASGYRPGGPNPLVPPPTAPGEAGAPPPSFSADRTLNYEVGVKAGWFDNRLTADVDAFWIRWSDIQVTADYVRAVDNYEATINAGDARSRGIEWSLTARPLPWLTLGWLGAYTDATLSQSIPALYASAGVQLPYVPKITQTVRADVNFRVSQTVNGFGGIQYNYIGTRLSAFNPTAMSSSIPIPAYDVVSGQIGVRFDRYTVEIFGKNLGDSRGMTSFADSATIYGIPLYATESLIRPREIGLRVAFDY